MTQDTTIVPVDSERLARLKKAVALASEGAFAQAAALLEHPADDDFGSLEDTLQAFIVELRVALEQSELALQDVLASREELQQKLTTIEQQQATIRELSTPIIDVWEGVITVPLSGMIDGERMEQLTTSLLARLPLRKTEWVILDLTGIDQVDTSIATHLMNLTSAVQLMGARCLVTGIKPRVAQTFVALQVGLETLRPMATLRSGLEFCIAHRRKST